MDLVLWSRAKCGQGVRKAEKFVDIICSYMALCSAAADDPLVLYAFPAFGDDLVKICGAHFSNQLRSEFVSTVCRANDMPKSVSVYESDETE